MSTGAPGGTPSSQRKHIALFGDTNAGKSSLFNALLGQSRALVSEVPGTTADPVMKAAELLSYGPVTLVDTAGFHDSGILGEARERKTRRWLDRADLALYVVDPGYYDAVRYTEMTALFRARRLPFLIVLMKSDLYREMVNAGQEKEETARQAYAATINDENVFRVSIHDNASVEALREAIAQKLSKETPEEPSLIAGLIAPGGVAVLVVPIDSGAPAGRLILPQVQLIRACLEEGIRCHVTTERQLGEVFQELSRVDLVITDSQVFATADKLTPPDIPLTSFSILTARQKGDFQPLLAGARQIRELTPGSRVLIAEACTHNATHEDIGRVKLPKVLEKAVGGKLNIDFCAGHEFPDDLSGYQLIVHCGGCMLTSRVFKSRQHTAAEQGVPFTNYGLALAADILERGVSCLKPHEYD